MWINSVRNGLVSNTQPSYQRAEYLTNIQTRLFLRVSKKKKIAYQLEVSQHKSHQKYFTHNLFSKKNLTIVLGTNTKLF